MLKTKIWVQAYLKTCHAAGLTGVVAHKGAEEAGAVFIRIFISNDSVRLFAPQPGPTYDEHGSRNWCNPLGTEPVSAETADDYVKRQLSFDSDIWVLDIEDKEGSGLLEISK